MSFVEIKTDPETLEVFWGELLNGLERNELDIAEVLAVAFLGTTNSLKTLLHSYTNLLYNNDDKNPIEIFAEHLDNNVLEGVTYNTKIFIISFIVNAIESISGRQVSNIDFRTFLDMVKETFESEEAQEDVREIREYIKSVRSR